jgi:hypothetical protein
LILKKKKYPWTQILDTNGTNAGGLNINKYPSNFLLDTEGKIIDIDIDPNNLINFLKKNI